MCLKIDYCAINTKKFYFRNLVLSYIFFEPYPRESKMAVIRSVEIKNFRSIQELNWQPQNGINYLIGPVDTGKSSLAVSLYFVN